jgi:hypothetical protein
MCAATCAFIGICATRYLAPDPSDPATRDPAEVDDRLVVVANLLFLEAVTRYSGPDAPMIHRARHREPETTQLLTTAGPTLFTVDHLSDGLERIRRPVEEAARARAERR